MDWFFLGGKNISWIWSECFGNAIAQEGNLFASLYLLTLFRESHHLELQFSAAFPKALSLLSSGAQEFCSRVKMTAGCFNEWAVPRFSERNYFTEFKSFTILWIYKFWDRLNSQWNHWVVDVFVIMLFQYLDISSSLWILISCLLLLSSWQWCCNFISLELFLN